MKPSVLVAVGCSWVAGAYMDTDPASKDFDHLHVVDTEYRNQYSFAGILQRQLGLDTIHFVARNGASNDDQVRNLLAFLNENRDNYSRIFVLWGLTSIYRWEMYSIAVKRIEDSAYGRNTHNPELEQEVKYYFSHFWNKEYELEKLGNKVTLLNGYLDNLNIEHLFFNSFQGYSAEELKVADINNKNFYKINESNNDMLSLLCEKNKIEVKKTAVPFLNLLRSPVAQFNSSSIKELQNQGWLDCATAHPTTKAHSLIAEELYGYYYNNKGKKS